MVCIAYFLKIPYKKRIPKNELKPIVVVIFVVALVVMLLIILGNIIEMRPCLYLLEESPSRALSRIALAVANQSIICINVPILNAACQQIAAHIQCILGGQLTHKASNETDAQRNLVVPQGVCTHRPPAASLIDITITADQEVIRNVIPATTLDVEAL